MPISPEQQLIYAALGYGPEGQNLPLGGQVAPIASPVPQRSIGYSQPGVPPSSWGGINALKEFLPSMPSFSMPELTQPGVPPSSWMGYQKILDTLKSLPIPNAPAGGLPVPSLEHVADRTLTSMHPAFGIMQALRWGDNYFGGPDEAGVATPGLPPLTFGDYTMPGGETASLPADEGISVPFDIDSLPKPPMLDAPPGVDMDRMQRATRGNILGAMAEGAASVDATEAGSFARALAAAGGGAASAAGQSQAKMAEVEYNNALNAYNVAMKNKEMEYEYEGKKFELMLPTMKATDDSVVIQEYKDGKYQVRVIPTGGLLGDADKLNKTIEAMSGPGPLAETMEVQYMAKLLANDPAALQTSLLRLAVERTIRNGAGEAVFGDAYKTASQSVNVAPGLINDAEAYEQALTKQISAKILSNPELMQDKTWLTEAAKYGSISANLLLNGGQL